MECNQFPLGKVFSIFPRAIEQQMITEYCMVSKGISEVLRVMGGGRIVLASHPAGPGSILGGPDEIYSLDVVEINRHLHCL